MRHAATEFLKEFIRLFFYPVALMQDGELYAEEGTWQYRFFLWLYGEESLEK